MLWVQTSNTVAASSVQIFVCTEATLNPLVTVFAPRHPLLSSGSAPYSTSAPRTPPVICPKHSARAFKKKSKTQPPQLLEQVLGARPHIVGLYQVQPTENPWSEAKSNSGTTVDDGMETYSPSSPHVVCCMHIRDQPLKQIAPLSLVRRSPEDSDSGRHLSVIHMDVAETKRGESSVADP